MSSSFQKDLDALIRFRAAFLSSDGVVGKEVDKLINVFLKEEKGADSSAGVKSNPSSPSKLMTESKGDANTFLLGELYFSPSGKSRSSFQDCLDINRIQSRNILELFVLFFHHILLQNGWVCVVEDNLRAPSLSGFAQPLRELSRRWIPDNFVSNNKSRLMYKFKPKMRNVVVECFQDVHDANLITLRISDNKNSATLELIASSYITIVSENRSISQFDEESLKGLFLEELSKLVPEAGVEFQSSNSPSASHGHEVLPSLEVHSDVADAKSGPPAMEILRHHSSHNHHPQLAHLPERASARNLPAVGDSDLNPFPSINISPASGGGLRPLGSPGDNGNLVGPQHPLFRSPNYNNSGSDAKYFPDFHDTPRARIDPVGPVTGPMGPNVGNIGIPSPDGLHAPFSSPNSRGSHRTRAPGEPNPDHLKPPEL